MIKQGIIKKTIDRRTFQIGINIYIILCTIFCLIPLFVTILNSLKSNENIILSIFGFTISGSATAENYTLAFNAIKTYFFRTIILSLIGATVDVMLGALLAYIFSFKEFPGKNFFFMMFISVMLLPSIMGMPILLPLVKDILHLADSEFLSYIGYLLPNFAGGQVTALFLFKTFFSQQPKDIYESARIEGANDLTIFFKITFPLAFPIILFQFVGIFTSLYNDYLWPSLLFNTDYTTLMPILVKQQTVFSNLSQSGATYALYMLSSIPLIIASIISMKHFVGGDFASGMKL